jgi:hypothetical protein
MIERQSLPRLLHTQDAAMILGVSTAWLERRRWQRLPPRYVRVGGPAGRAVRYREIDLLDYIEENTVDFSVRIA